MIVSTLPLVSVVIPAYNAEKFLGSTLTSVLAQSYPNVEVLVVDDGSTDKTPEIIRSFSQRDHRVSFLKKANGGVASARNHGIRASKGELIAPCDSDDTWYPDKLREQVECLLRTDASVGIVYCWSRIMDEEERPIVDISHAFEGRVFVELMYSNFLGNGSCALIRRSCFDKVGGYNGETTPCEEWDLYLRIAEHYELRLVPKILVGYREVLTGLSADYRRMESAFAALTREVRRRHPDFPRSMTRLSKSYFYIYLTGKSSRQSQYAITLQYLWKSLAADPMRLLSSEFHLILLKSIIRLVAKPITSKIWQDDRSWRVLKQKLKSKLGNKETSRPLKEENTSGEGGRSLRLYDRIHRNRMMRFREATRLSFQRPVNQTAAVQQIVGLRA